MKLASLLASFGKLIVGVDEKRRLINFGPSKLVTTDQIQPSEPPRAHSASLGSSKHTLQRAVCLWKFSSFWTMKYNQKAVEPSDKLFQFKELSNK